MKKRLIVGNWKMNPASLDEARKIIRKTRRVAGELKRTDVVACPPFVYIPASISRWDPKTLPVGAQSVSFDESGPHTGEVSATQLADMGVKYVIAGHSEVRASGDTDEMVSKRILATLSHGMTPIVCVGEKVRDEGGAYLETLKEQIKNTFAYIESKYGKDIIIAYEPIWAIGAKEAMQPAQVYEMSLFVKKVFADIFGQASAMSVKVLYGGSVNARNASDIISIGKVDGLLVGRESVNPVGFIELLRAVDEIV